MPWFTYMLRCKDDSFYVGISNDVQKRVQLHNTGIGSSYLLNKLPVKLIYSEKYANKSQARKREIQLKGWSKTKKEKLISGIWKQN